MDDVGQTPEVGRARGWRRTVSIGLGALLFVCSFTLLHTTAGTGGIATGIACSLAVTWWFVWRRGSSPRRQLWTAARTMTAVMVVWNLVSFTHYVAHDNGDHFDQRVATWGRDHGLGDLIDRMEAIVYSDPPSKTPARSLTLDRPATTSVPTPVTEPADTTTSTIAPPQPPAALTTWFPTPLPGEGQWVPLLSAGGETAMWGTSLRPLPDYGGVVASMVVIDQTHVRAGMFNGNEQPGGTWARDSKVPPELYPSLLAVMNGGFRFEQMDGGYKTEGKEVQPLKAGRATLAIDRAGHIHVGEFGRDLFDDGTWLTLRQNLMLMVDGGQSNMERARQQHVFFGADKGNQTYVNRSAACELADGRFAYVMAGKLDAPQLAQVLLNVGCVRGMQLDINNAWPTFLWYEHPADGTLVPHRLDKRMNISPLRYVKGSSKEFFAFFDATLVPAISVLDA